MLIRVKTPAVAADSNRTELAGKATARAIEPVDATEVMFALVNAKVKVVEVGTDATVKVPLRTVSVGMPVVVTTCPTVKP